jgi:hypothetical protein
MNISATTLLASTCDSPSKYNDYYGRGLQSKATLLRPYRLHPPFLNVAGQAIGRQKARSRRRAIGVGLDDYAFEHISAASSNLPWSYQASR